MVNILFVVVAIKVEWREICGVSVVKVLRVQRPTFHNAFHFDGNISQHGATTE